MQDPVSSRSATSQSRLLGVESGLLMVSSTRIGHRYFLSSSTAASQRVHDRPTHENPAGVSSIELFFDLVFVFVITQVTQLVEHAHGC